MRKFRLALILTVAGCATGGGGAAPRAATTSAMAPQHMEFPAADSSAVVHLLNRLAFGPKPGDIARVQRTGIGAWLEQQLDPEGIPDTAGRQVRQLYAVAFLSPAELYRRYPPPNLARRAAETGQRAGGPARAGRRDDMMDGREAPPDSMMLEQIQRGYRELGGHVIMGRCARGASA